MGLHTSAHLRMNGSWPLVSREGSWADEADRTELYWYTGAGIGSLEPAVVLRR